MQGGMGPGQTRPSSELGASFIVPASGTGSQTGQAHGSELGTNLPAQGGAMHRCGVQEPDPPDPPAAMVPPVPLAPAAPIVPPETEDPPAAMVPPDPPAIPPETMDPPVLPTTPPETWPPLVAPPAVVPPPGFKLVWLLQAKPTKLAKRRVATPLDILNIGSSVCPRAAICMPRLAPCVLRRFSRADADIGCDAGSEI